MKIEENRKFDFGEFRFVINQLEKNGLSYFVFGGFAYDGILERANEHNDLDLVFHEKDRKAAVSMFKGWGYDTYLLGRKEKYSLTTGGLPKRKIDILFLQDCGTYYELMGNRVRDRVSKNVFYAPPRVDVKGVEFNIMPYEWFSLYSGRHIYASNPERTRAAIEKASLLCRKVEVLQQDEVEMPCNMQEVRI